MENIYFEHIDIIGFDFGHGETSLAKVSSSAKDSDPEMLEISARKNQVTALAFKPDYGDLIGEQALKTTGITELHIGFKPQRHNLNNPDHQRTVQRFIRKYLDILKQSGQISGDDRTLFVVGSPSGWSKAERQTYRDILKQAGMQRITVEKESRAAFLHLKESKSTGVNTDELMQHVLIIDIGSSTTDFTIVDRMEAHPIDDFGLNLGAGLIEETIFERTMIRLKQEHPETLKRFEDIFEKFPHFKRQCLMACREGKEKFFSIPELYGSADQSVDCSYKIRTVKPPIEFEPVIHREEMENILSIPMPALQGPSWKEVFRTALEHARSKMAEAGPNLVVLTGGASRMDVVLSLCHQVFSSAKKIVRGVEPEFTIAKGLARIGRTDILSHELKQTIESISHTNELITLVEKHIPILINYLAEPIANELIIHVVTPALTAWREGRLKTLNDIYPDIENRKINLTDLIDGEETGKILDGWLNATLLPALADRTDPICKHYDIPRSALYIRTREISTGIRLIDHLPFKVDQIIRSDIVIVVTSMLAGIIVGMASGGTGMALLHLPIAGQVIAAVVGAIITGFGVDAVTEIIKEKNLPRFSRSWILPDNKLYRILTEQRANLCKSIAEQMAMDHVWKKTLSEDILRKLKAILEEQVKKAVMWIR